MAVIAIEEHFTSPELRKLIAPREGPIQAMLDNMSTRLIKDMDDVFMGHQHMRDTGKYEHMWGIGRHLLGSQVYDYWADPWRRVHEHWADSDRLNIKNGSNLLSAEEALVSQWGDPPPQQFIEHVSA